MRIALGLVISLVAATATAQVHVDGYYRRDGTYVAPHYRTAPDSSRHNNYSTQGNYNPYTGRAGTVNPYSQPAPRSTYQSPQSYQPQPYRPYSPYR